MMQPSGKGKAESSGKIPPLSADEAEEFAASFRPAWEVAEDSAEGTDVMATSLGDVPSGAMPPQPAPKEPFNEAASVKAVPAAVPSSPIAPSRVIFAGNKTLMGGLSSPLPTPPPPAPAAAPASPPAAPVAAPSSEVLDPDAILEVSSAPAPRAAPPPEAAKPPPAPPVKAQKDPFAAPPPVAARTGISTGPARSPRKASAVATDEYPAFVPKKSNKALYIVLALVGLGGGGALFALTQSEKPSTPITNTHEGTTPAPPTADIPPPTKVEVTAAPKSIATATTTATATAAKQPEPAAEPTSASTTAARTHANPAPPPPAKAAPPPRVEPKVTKAPPPLPAAPKPAPKPAPGGIVRDNPF